MRRPSPGSRSTLVASRAWRIGGNTRADRLDNEVEYLSSPPDQAYGMNVARMDAHGRWISTASDLVWFALHLPRRLNPAIPSAFDHARPEPHLRPRLGGEPGAQLVAQRQPAWHHSILVRTAGGLCWAGLANGRTDQRRGIGSPDVAIGTGGSGVGTTRALGRSRVRVAAPFGAYLPVASRSYTITRSKKALQVATKRAWSEPPSGSTRDRPGS